MTPRKTLFAALLALPMFVWGADGDEFTAKTIEGIDMTFKVISEADKTCQVGTCTDESNWTGYTPRAIDTSITGTVTIPAEANGYRIEIIGNHAFCGCAFSTIVIPGGLRLIDTAAFDGCHQLETVTFQGSVETIGRDAFRFCHRDYSGGYFTSIHLPEGLRHILSGAFYTCSGLTDVTFPSTLETIGSNAFYLCAITSPLTLPEGLWYIGNEAFDGKQIPSIYIPSSVTYIGDNFVQSGISGIQSITVSPQNPVYDSRDNCNAIIHTATNTLIKGCPKTVIPASVKAIGNGAFKAQTLSSINLPQGLESIGDYAFLGCKNLTSVVIPEGVKYLGGTAFAQCSNLTSITIPSTIERTGNLTGYGKNVFDYTPWEDNLPAGLNYIGHVAYKYVGDMPANTTIALREGTTAIENYCFAKCKNLSSINLPDDLTEIGESAFFDCESLTNVEFPASLRKMKSGAFSSCTGLTAFVIPEGVTTIGSSVISGCSNIATLSVPQSVTEIDYDGFGKEGMAWYDALPEGPIYLGQVFYDYKGTAPASLTIAQETKGIAGAALEYKQDLTSVFLPDGLTNIKYSALSIPLLEEIVFPATVQHLGTQYWPRIKAIYALSEEPFDAGFSVSDYKATLYVPVGAAYRYAHHPGWYLFENIVERDMSDLSAIEMLTSDKASNPSSHVMGYYTPLGRRAEAPRHGLHIVRLSDGTARKVIVP